MTAPARLSRWLALSGLLALAGCGDDREPLVVAAVSGARIDLTGTTCEIQPTLLLSQGALEP